MSTVMTQIPDEKLIAMAEAIVASLKNADPDLQWAAAVATLAELLKGSPYVTSSVLPDIDAIVKCLQQALVAGKVRHDTQLDLGVISREQLPTLPGHEGLSNFPALFRTDGNILQVRI